MRHVPRPHHAANIRRTKERIDLLIKEKGRGNQDAVLDKLGITVRENVDLMRIQLFFDEKPTAEVRQVLKGWGFKWAPSSGCWQRQLTNNARYAVKQVIDRLKEEFVQGGG